MDPLSAIVAMLKPTKVLTTIVTGKGCWGARYSNVDSAGFGLVLKGRCHVSAGGPYLFLEKGDFVFMLPPPKFAICTDLNVEQRPITPRGKNDISADRHHGEASGNPDFKLLGGYFWFDAMNGALLTSLLPPLLHIRRSDVVTKRLRVSMQLLADEARDSKEGRDLIVARLVEIILAESIRPSLQGPVSGSRQGLLKGMADRHVFAALRCIHSDPSRHWTVAELARDVGLSRSAFFDRFIVNVGITPMQYIMRWRMSLAKEMLRIDNAPLERVAERLGYQSASAFSTAFSREVGQSPALFRAHLD